jgi:excisionase family DNA binding protein
MRDKLFTVDEVARMLRISNMTVYRLVKNEEIAAIKVGKNYRIRESEVDKYLKRGSTLVSNPSFSPPRAE